VILKWLQALLIWDRVGDLESAHHKALSFGIKPENIFVKDLHEEFVCYCVSPVSHANATHEGEYLLWISIASPLIAKHQSDIAIQTRSDAISHGAILVRVMIK
jgi:argininosuccinate synthase